MRNLCLLSSLFLFLAVSCSKIGNSDNLVSTGSLIDELADLGRLTEMPEYSYRTIQFSSYDRRSTHPSDPGWFQNSDGFGGEPIPGFISTITPPDKDGIGEYLLCDVKGPGAIVRTWTARINGEITLYLDNYNEPVYSGSAEDFMWNTAAALGGNNSYKDLDKIFRQNDGSYFPLAFQQACKITWKGDLDKLHFYHIELRVYNEDVKVETFTKSDIEKYKSNIDELSQCFSRLRQPDLDELSESLNVDRGHSDTLYSLSGEKEIINFAIKIDGNNVDKALRSTVLKIYFDNGSVPQVNSPLGDFFGAAPGINPYGSLPFTVTKEGVMECRYHMPFKNSAVIIVENRGDEVLEILSGIETGDYRWDDNKSLHFRAKWRIDRALSASNTDIQDIPYLLAQGKGRFVGVSAFIMNPTDVPTSWGNWWGEGDEKIFVDDPERPVFIGTGSEDYFNYSWSSAALFDYAFCGQPRNDGPANRGFVTNYRYQILDDIPFYSSFAFYMELLHHGKVEGFDYARISYYYASPGTIDDVMEISDPDIIAQRMPLWEKPEAYLGSGNAIFIESENISSVSPADRLFPGYLWSGGRILFYEFKEEGEKIFLRLNLEEEKELSLNLIMAHSPDSRKVKLYIEGMEEETIVNFDLFLESGIISRSHALKKVKLKKGINKIIIENAEDGQNSVGIDFLWFK